MLVSLLAALALAAQPALPAADDPAWSRDGTQIAFDAGTSTARSLYVMSVDGSGLRRLTADGFDARWPTWSPDGRTIAFEHEYYDQGWHADVYAVGSDGSGVHRVVANAWEPAWGPGGRAIAFSRSLGGDTDSGHLIRAVAPDGTGLRIVANPHNDCETYVEPTWSPDGEWVAFAADGAGGECGYDVFVGANRGDGDQSIRLANGWFSSPDWSPKRRLVAVQERSPDLTFPDRVAVIDLRTHRIRRLRSGRHPRWSPDGRRLVFVRGTQDRSSQLWLMRADGSHLQQLTR